MDLKEVLEIKESFTIKRHLILELEKLENSDSKLKYIDNAEMLINLGLINLLIDFERKIEEEGTVEGILAYLTEKLILIDKNEVPVNAVEEESVED